VSIHDELRLVLSGLDPDIFTGDEDQSIRIIALQGGDVSIRLLRMLACENGVVNPADILYLLTSEAEEDRHDHEQVLELIMRDHKHLFSEILMNSPEYVEMPVFESISQHRLWNQHARSPGKSNKDSSGRLSTMARAHKKYL
jgi:hypothetical protein